MLENDNLVTVDFDKLVKGEICLKDGKDTICGTEHIKNMLEGSRRKKLVVLGGMNK